MNNQDRRLVIVSNRLPIVIDREEENWRIVPGAGGLITALAPIMRRNSGLWVGWPGCGEEAPLEELFASFSAEQGYQLVPVPLSAEQVEKYYQGFSNEALWPLFHDLLGHCRFQEDTWHAYREVNAKFAKVLLDHCRPSDLIWVHDYQLLLVGQALNELGVRQSLGFFLHIPFPSPDLYRRLPWRDEIIRAMLAYDLIGFQTLRDRRNFVACATSLLPDTEVISRHRHYTLLRSGERFVKVGHYPISIDFGEFHDAANTREVADAAWYLHEQLGERQLLLGIDRLDYTKGIPDRFLAFERALAKYPELHQRISLLQVVVPSRTLVADYQDLKEELDRLAGHINARFSQAGWTPIYYVFRSLERVQLLAHYRASEIALVTPLRDGMNLVAKEYCAASVDGNSVLILSEFAGAADELGRNALLVNPYDIEATADAIHQAFVMEHPERQRRMRLLQSEVRRHDVHLWLRRFMEHLAGTAGLA